MKGFYVKSQLEEMGEENELEKFLLCCPAGSVTAKEKHYLI